MLTDAEHELREWAACASFIRDGAQFTGNAAHQAHYQAAHTRAGHLATELSGLRLDLDAMHEIETCAQRLQIAAEQISRRDHTEIPLPPLILRRRRIGRPEPNTG
jgi:hypothetical protein